MRVTAKLRPSRKLRALLTPFELNAETKMRSSPSMSENTMVAPPAV